MDEACPVERSFTDDLQGALFLDHQATLHQTARPEELIKKTALTYKWKSLKRWDYELIVPSRDLELMDPNDHDASLH